MWKLYDELIDGIPAHVKAEQVCFGPTRVTVTAQGNMGLATLTSGCWNEGRLNTVDALRGTTLRDLAAKAKSWDFEQAALGMAAMNAWYNHADKLLAGGAEIFAPGTPGGDAFRDIAPLCAGKKVASIGHFPGTKELFGSAEQFLIFERDPREGDLPDSAEEYLLPEMDVVFITGMTFTNKTLPRLLQLCSAAQVIVTGPSLPLAPVVFDHGVCVLCGTTVTDGQLLLQKLPEGGRSLYAALGKVIWKRGRA